MEALGALGLTGRVLVVLADDDVVAHRSFANLQTVQAVQVGELCAYDILRNDWIVFTDRTLPGAEAADDDADGTDADGADAAGAEVGSAGAEVGSAGAGEATAGEATSETENSDA